MLSFSTRLDTLPHIKPFHFIRFKQLGIETVRDLFMHCPARYEDFTALVPISAVQPGERVTVEGVVRDLSSKQTWKKKLFLTEALIDDDTGTLRAIWFNQRFVGETLRVGIRVRLSGKVVGEGEERSLQNPAFERAERMATHTGRLVPVYPETAGLTSKFIRWQIATLFQKLPDFPDAVPGDILARLHLPSLRKALQYLHFPRNEKEVLLAKKRLAFDDMFLLQLKMLEVQSLFAHAKSLSLPEVPEHIEEFTRSLPFALTAGQIRAQRAIAADLTRCIPMHRLLNGDVGSGKTLVALLAILQTTLNGAQAALLAPTEILARQHYATFRRLLSEQGHSLALLTADQRLLDGKPLGRTGLLAAIRSGIARITIGTHALIAEDVAFERLALIVVDEQHRFGVAQRAALQEKTTFVRDGERTNVPHFLAMTATPIPRSLALTLFGNLDLSLLDEVPAHKQPISTKVIGSDREREAMYACVREEIARGHQAFVILPLIDESKALASVKAATAEHARLARDIFPDLRLALLHGKMKSRDKEKIMQAFQNQDFDILVSTAVVEVGIDIPNATVIIIEEAERFGLAQLHQFRGRVGRGPDKSRCYLLPGKFGSPENARLQALEKTESGFSLADIDLKLRGPGSFLGHRQSGLPDIGMESLTNVKLIEIARSEARALLERDPGLRSCPALRRALDTFDERLHLE